MANIRPSNQEKLFASLELTVRFSDRQTNSIYACIFKIHQKKTKPGQELVDW